MSKRDDHPDKLKRKDYEADLERLQTELCHLQDWVKKEGERIIIVFEGRARFPRRRPARAERP
jgi:polyphosphate kinase 2 (PPK2 family)